MRVVASPPSATPRASDAVAADPLAFSALRDPLEDPLSAGPPVQRNKLNVPPSHDVESFALKPRGVDKLRTAESYDSDKTHVYASGFGLKEKRSQNRWVTQISWQRPLGRYDEGVGVEAHPLGPDHPKGAQPSSTGLHAARQRVLTALSGEAYVAGHILNHRVGGPGDLRENLTAIPSGSNTQFEIDVEDKVKTLVNDLHRWVYFKVDVDYGSCQVKDFGPTAQGRVNPVDWDEQSGEKFTPDARIPYATRFRAVWHGYDEFGKALNGKTADVTFPKPTDPGAHAGATVVNPGKWNHGTGTGSAATADLPPTFVPLDKDRLDASHRTKAFPWVKSTDLDPEKTRKQIVQDAAKAPEFMASLDTARLADEVTRLGAAPGFRIDFDPTLYDVLVQELVGHIRSTHASGALGPYAQELKRLADLVQRFVSACKSARHRLPKRDDLDEIGQAAFDEADIGGFLTAVSSLAPSTADETQRAVVKLKKLTGDHLELYRTRRQEKLEAERARKEKEREETRKREAEERRVAREKEEAEQQAQMELLRSFKIKRKAPTIPTPPPTAPPPTTTVSDADDVVMAPPRRQPSEQLKRTSPDHRTEAEETRENKRSRPLDPRDDRRLSRPGGRDERDEHDRSHRMERDERSHRSGGAGSYPSSHASGSHRSSHGGSSHGSSSRSYSSHSSGSHRSSYSSSHRSSYSSSHHSHRSPERDRYRRSPDRDRSSRPPDRDRYPKPGPSHGGHGSRSHDPIRYDVPLFESPFTTTSSGFPPIDFAAVLEEAQRQKALRESEQSAAVDQGVADYYRVGHADGDQNSCLIHSLIQLATGRGADAVPTTEVEWFRSKLKHLVDVGTPIDLAAEGGRTVISEVERVYGTKLTVNVVAGTGRGSLPNVVPLYANGGLTVHLFWTGPHFVPAWPKG